MDMLSRQDLITATLRTFQAEKNRDIDVNMSIVHDEFEMTDVVFTEGSLFLKHAGENMRNLMKQAFEIRGRNYEFITVLADELTQTVMVEFIEDYPDPETGVHYVTPQVAICIFKDGKLYRTRHYMDPRLSRQKLSLEQIKNALR